MNIGVSRYLFIFLLCVGAGCANITTPTGGKKDITPPKLVSITPPNFQTNARTNRVELHFDEYITVSDAVKEVQISPMLPISPTVTGLNKHVVVKIVDSLLEDNTTYRISFGSAIKDLHEGNPFTKYTYTFSTGGYFDSLQLSGTITNALTGLSDMEGIWVELYSAIDNDSAVVRHKPKYVTKAEPNGTFVLKGLPARTFRIYALKDANDNLIYDGPLENEQIGFADYTVTPGDTTQPPISLRVFAEIPDTGMKKSTDSTAFKKDRIGARSKSTASAGFTYTVNLDTSNVERKTFDVNFPVKINFSRLPLFNNDKITLSYDSINVAVPAVISLEIDSVQRVLAIKPNRWRENTVYTLRLAKGFAKDTAGSDLTPSKYVFRTKDEDDYGKITMHLPAKYLNSMYLFRVMADGDSIYQQPVRDTMITLRYLKPAKYTFRIIVDRNHNGKWDTGDLLGKKQPEEVIPHRDAVPLRAGFEDIEDFTEPKSVKSLKDRAGSKR
jgi:hypothetical protein